MHLFAFSWLRFTLTLSSKAGQISVHAVSRTENERAFQTVMVPSGNAARIDLPERTGRLKEDLNGWAVTSCRVVLGFSMCANCWEAERGV